MEGVVLVCVQIYKSTKCNDMHQCGSCPRGPFCAFAHLDSKTLTTLTLLTLTFYSNTLNTMTLLSI